MIDVFMREAMGVNLKYNQSFTSVVVSFVYKQSVDSQTSAVILRRICFIFKGFVASTSGDNATHSEVSPTATPHAGSSIGRVMP